MKKTPKTREAIDASFKAMASDKEYQDETIRIIEEFAASDAEALRIGEQGLSKE